MENLFSENILTLYDKDDVNEFNNLKSHTVKKIFVFSPGIEDYILNKEKYLIHKCDDAQNIIIQKKIIITSEKIYQEYVNNLKLISELDNGLKENIHNIFFASVFSYLYLIKNLAQFKKFYLIKNGYLYKFDNFGDFIYEFLNKISNKENQDFFRHVKPKTNSSFIINLIKLSNFFCNKSKSLKKVVVGAKLSKKLLKILKNNIIIEIKSQSDFKIYHLIYNFFGLMKIFSKKKKFFYFPDKKYENQKSIYDKQIEKFVTSFKNNQIQRFSKILTKILINYCKNQIYTKKSLNEFIEKNKIDTVFVDQLRYGVSTVISNLCNEKKINVVLIPHGSISEPEENISKFVIKICARGLVYSGLADFIVAQTKISYNAIKYFNENSKIIKAVPVLFGERSLKNNLNKNKFIFLHASTPKSLSKWPWIYENYTEYVSNIKDIIKETRKFKNVILLIRFRAGPECNLETFKKLIQIEKYKHVKISSNINFFEDLSQSNCLISFSSTAIEETLCLNKKVLIYSNNKNYKHINYDLNEKSILYSNKNKLSLDIKKILDEKTNPFNNIYWEDENINKDFFYN